MGFRDRLLWPHSASEASVCLARDALFAPRSSEWRRYLLHLLWPTDIIPALLDGRAWHGSWWAAAVPGTEPLLHLGLSGALSSQGFMFCKFLIVFAFPLLLSPFRYWAYVYAGACVLLVMYTMTSEVWIYPHIGFATLFYLVYAFWKLPGLPEERVHRS